MFVIKVWCLPKASEKRLRFLYESIVKMTLMVKELALTKDDITVLFPPDMMKYGLGTEIIIEVSHLFEKPERTHAVKNNLAKNLCDALKMLYPRAKVECIVETHNPESGFWSS